MTQIFNASSFLIVTVFLSCSLTKDSRQVFKLIGTCAWHHFAAVKGHHYCVLQRMRTFVVVLAAD